MNDDVCEICGGDGVWCGIHSTPDGCDCEDDVRIVPYDDCGGTGRRDEEDEDDE